MPQSQSDTIAQVFDSYPSAIRGQALRLRELIFGVAKKTEGVGCIEETLQWGEPAYVAYALSTRAGTPVKQSAKTQTAPRFPAKERVIGSAVRIGWKARDPNRIRLLFHCQRTLIDSFRERFRDEFTFEGNRAIVFGIDERINLEATAQCIAASQTYRLS